MNGLINDARKPGNDITPQMIRSKMNIPPNLVPVYDKIILAAKKIMYSEAMQKHIKELLGMNMPIGQKLGLGATALVALINSKSNNTMPKDLIIPIAIELVAEAADFLRKAGLKISDKDVGAGIADTIKRILERSGIKPDQLPAMIEQMKQGPGAPPKGPPQGPPPGAPPAPPQPQPPMRG